MDYTLIIEKGKDNSLIGSIVELPGCYSEGQTLSELENNIKEAIRLYIETEKPEKETEFIGIHKVTV